MAKKDKEKEKEEKLKSRALAEILNSAPVDKKNPVRSYSQGAAGTLGRNARVR